MPTPWKRSPEELHKTYLTNTEAFYRIAGRGLAPELDDFVTACALGLWKGSAALGQQHADAQGADPVAAAATALKIPEAAMFWRALNVKKQ